MVKDTQERQKDFVAKRAKDGWRRLQAWVPAEYWDEAKRFIERLAKRREKK